MAVLAQVRSTDVRQEIIRFLKQECVIGSSVGSTTFNDDSIGKWPKRRGVRGTSDLTKWPLGVIGARESSTGQNRVNAS